MSYNDTMIKEPESTSADAMSGTDAADGTVINSADDVEVFKKADGVVDFRTVGWPMASIIFLKRKSSVISMNAGAKQYTQSCLRLEF